MVFIPKIFPPRLRKRIAGKSAQVGQATDHLEDVSIEDIRLSGFPSATEASSTSNAPPESSSNPRTTTPESISASQRLARTPKYGLGVLYEPPESPRKPATADEAGEVLTKKQQKKNGGEGKRKELRDRNGPTKPIVE